MAQSTMVERSAQTEAVSEAVVYAVAERTDTDPKTLEPLHDVVDPDALNALFETKRTGLSRPPVRVTFTYCGCEVVISADGTVRASRIGQETSKNWR